MLEDVLFNQPVYIGVGETVQAVLNLAELQREAFDGVFGLLVTIGLQPADFLPAVLLLIGKQAQPGECFEK